MAIPKLTKIRTTVCVVAATSMLFVAGCAPTSIGDAVDEQKFTPKSADGNAASNDLNQWAGEAVTKGISAAFSAGGIPGGAAVGQAALGWLGLGGGGTSLGQVLAELEVIEQELTEISDQIAVLGQDIEEMNCDNEMQPVTADAAVIQANYSDFLANYEALQEIAQVRRHGKSADQAKDIELQQKVQAWSALILAELPVTLNNFSSAMFNAGNASGLPSGALAACQQNVLAEWKALYPKQAVPAYAVYTELNQALAFGFTYQAYALTMLANAAQFNAQTTLNGVVGQQTAAGAPFVLTNEVLGLVEQNGTTVATTSLCDVVGNLINNGTFSQGSTAIQDLGSALSSCLSVYGTSAGQGTLELTRSNMITQMNYIGIPVSDIVAGTRTDSAGNTYDVPAFVEVAPGAPTGTDTPSAGILAAASLEAANPYFTGDDCSQDNVLPVYPGCGTFLATNSGLTVDTQVPAGQFDPGNPFAIGKANTSWRSAQIADLGTFSATIVANKPSGYSASDFTTYLSGPESAPLPPSPSASSSASPAPTGPPTPDPSGGPYPLGFDPTNRKIFVASAAGVIQGQDQCVVSGTDAEAVLASVASKSRVAFFDTGLGSFAQGPAWPLSAYDGSETLPHSNWRVGPSDLIWASSTTGATSAALSATPELATWYGVVQNGSTEGLAWMSLDGSPGGGPCIDTTGSLANVSDKQETVTELSRPLWTDSTSITASNTGFQLPVIDYSAVSPTVAQVNPVTGFMTLNLSNASIAAQYLPDRIPPLPTTGNPPPTPTPTPTAAR